MRRRGAGRGHAPIEKDSSSAPDDAGDDAGDAPWARHVGPYPISSFALDHALPERGLDAALRGREAEFRAFDGNLQAPTIRRFLFAGLVAAAARLANPLLRYDTKFAPLSPACQRTHVLENTALAGICVYCLARGFGVNRKTRISTSPPSYWWHCIFLVLYCGAFARHFNECRLHRAGRGGMVGEQFTAFFVVALLVVGWRPPLAEVITSRVMGWALYTTVITQYTMVHWYSHIVRFACGVLMPIALAALLDVRARRLFADELAMHVGAGVWGLAEEERPSRGSTSARNSPAMSPWQSPSPSPQYELR